MEGLRVRRRDGEERIFRIAATTDGGRAIRWSPTPVQSGQVGTAWRIPLHLTSAGLGRSKDDGLAKYQAANADAVSGPFIAPPPKVRRTVVVGPTADGLLRGPVWYDGRLWFIMSQHAVSVDEQGVVRLEKDFQTDYGAVPLDMAVFNGELVFALGEQTPIVIRRADGSWYQGTDAVYAIALGTVGERLWRAAQRNKLVACFNAPEREDSWAPSLAAPGVPVVGDATYPIHTVIDYAGIPWAIKADGCYQPDATSRYYPQVPQLGRWPHPENGVGAFTAFGYLWLPSITGLIRVAPGEALSVGWELLERGHSGVRILAGVEWRGSIWLLSESTEAQQSLIRMVRDRTGATGRPYVFHEVLSGLESLPAAAPLRGAAVGIIPAYPHPQLVWAHGSSEIRIISLGCGGCAEVDDPHYEYGQSMWWISGSFQPVEDESVESVLVGVDAVVRVPDGASLRVSYAVDPVTEFAPEWVPMVNYGEHGEAYDADIRTGNRVETARRMALPGATGRRFSIRLDGVLPDGLLGANRVEVRELWAYGYARPRMTDVLTVSLYGAVGTVDSRLMPYRAEEIHKFFRSLLASSEPVQLSVAGYDELPPSTWWLVVDVQVREARTSMPLAGQGVEPVHEVQVSFVRLDYGRTYAL